MDELQLRARAAYLSLCEKKKTLAVAILEAWALDDSMDAKPKKAALTLVPHGGGQVKPGNSSGRRSKHPAPILASQAVRL